MSSPVPLLNDKHANLKVISTGDYTRYKENHLISIVTQDFFTLTAEFPLVFVKGNEANEFIPVAIMGLREGQNLYCQTEKWIGQVIPLSFGSAPFSIARTSPESEEFAVLIEEDSPLVSDTEGEALFTESGERTEYLERRVESMTQLAQHILHTKAVCKLLADNKLFSTQRLQLKHRPDAKTYNIDGVYTVNEEALNGLPDEDFLKLRTSGLLPMIYAHLSSLQQLRRISQMQYEADKAAEE
ncbi:multidrug transporter [bacterium]|nr:MAG: multidrug transporter [bacterium]